MAGHVLKHIAEETAKRAAKNTPPPKSLLRSGPVVHTQESLDAAMVWKQKDIEARRNGKMNARNRFKDDEGSLWRTDAKGKDAKGEQTYSWRNQSNKDTQNAAIPGRRNDDAELTTQGERDFYQDRDAADTDAHHISELRRTARLFEGLEEREQEALFRLFRKKGLSIGDTKTNRAELPQVLHKEFHSWFDNKYPRRNASLKDLTLKERKQEIGQFIAEYQAAMEQMYTMVQEKNSLKIK